LASVFLTVSVGMAASLEAKRQTKMSHVVTASDETKKKRIHSNEFVSVCFGLKFVLVVKKRENAKRNPVLSA
jgi:hypothetical protein